MRKCAHSLQNFETSETTVEFSRKQKTYACFVQRISCFVAIWQFTSRKYKPSFKPVNPALQLVEMIIQHQVQPIVNMPDLKNQFRMGNCSICRVTCRTAWIACKQPYCYNCGREHLRQLLMENAQGEPSADQEIQMALETQPQIL